VRAEDESQPSPSEFQNPEQAVNVGFDLCLDRSLPSEYPHQPAKAQCIACTILHNALRQPHAQIAEKLGS